MSRFLSTIPVPTRAFGGLEPRGMLRSGVQTKRLSQRFGDGRRYYSVAVLAHAGYLVLASGDELFTVAGASPVLEGHRYPVLR